MYSTEVITALFELLRLAFGESCESGKLSVLKADDWNSLFELASRQGVLAIAFDGYKNFVEANPEKSLLKGSDELDEARMNWYGNVMRMEGEYEDYCGKLRSLCASLRDNGMKPVVMKGFGLARNYAVPEHRPSGDIDIYVPGVKPCDVDKILHRRSGCKCGKDRQSRHSKCLYEGLQVENHYRISYADGLIARRYHEFEELLRKLIVEGAEDQGEFMTPGANFNALFLMWHMSRHFAHERLTLRQLCDWKAFVMRYGKDVDWDMVKMEWQKVGLKFFADALNGAVALYLGPAVADVAGLISDNGSDKYSPALVTGIFEYPKKVNGFFGRLLYYPREDWRFRLATSRGWFCALWERVAVRL